MIVSMTGFGAAEQQTAAYRVRVEIKSINSKYFECTFRLPKNYFEQEIRLKNQVAAKLGRGKVNCSISVQHKLETQAGPLFDVELLKAYHKQLEALGRELGQQGYIPITEMLNLPGIWSEGESTVSEEEWALVEAVTEQALEAIVTSRLREGKTLDDEMRARIVELQALSAQVPAFEAERMDAVKGRLQQNLAQTGVPLDPQDARFQQELVFYLERIDITEERVRLGAHLQLFLDTMGDKESQGRKLNFIAQEIGREVNTLGAKAYHSGLQAVIVQMKDELEKVKEQLGNIL